MPTGERFYCEQISHHPPITAYSLHGPNDEYVLSGSHKLNGWLNGMNSLGGSKKGKAELRFADDDSLYLLDNPEMSIENMLGTNKRHCFYKKCSIQDVKNQMTAEISFNPNFNSGVGGAVYRNTIGWIPGMNGLGKNKSKNQGSRDARGDDFAVTIRQIIAKIEKSGKGIEKTIATGSGSWLSHLIINNEVLWRIEDPCPRWVEPAERMADGTPVLESDSRCRSDLYYIQTQQWETAE